MADRSESTDASSAGWSVLTAPHNDQNVLTYQITRDMPLDISSRGQEIAYLPPPTPHSSFHTPHSESPFLGLSFAALTPESIHLTDPFAQLSTPQSTVRTPQLKRGVTNMLMSREYWRYLDR